MGLGEVVLVTVKQYYVFRWLPGSCFDIINGVLSGCQGVTMRLLKKFCVFGCQYIVMRLHKVLCVWLLGCCYEGA